MRTPWSFAALGLVLLAVPSAARGQQAGRVADTAAVAGVCDRAGASAAAVRAQVPTGTGDATSVDARQEARRLSAAATQAELLGDAEAAVDLLRRALRADPSSADDRYRLARLLETSGDTVAAVKDYCRYIALAPGGQDRANAEARLLALAPPPLPASESGPTRRSVPQPQKPAAAAPPAGISSLAPPRSVLVRGLLLPGSGQVSTGRTPLGLAVGIGVGGAVAAGVLTKKVSVDCLSEPADGVCPAADVLRRQVERPLLVPGIAVAAAGTILAAIEAYHYRSQQIQARAGSSGAAERTSARLLPPSGSAGADGVELHFIRIRF